MGFETLLGNEALKQRLSAALAKGQLSHCYLLSGPEGSGKHTLARLLAAAMQCTQPQKPCFHCAQCRKVLDGMHPDVITVDEPDKKSISVKQVRDACADLYIRPNEGAKKIYVFPRAQELNPQGQNALLKCIEEPPAYGVFLLLADNPNKLLPTVRSRCTELKLLPLPQEVLLAQLKKEFPTAAREDLLAAASRSGGFLGQAKQLLESGLRDISTFGLMTAYSREEIREILNHLKFLGLVSWDKNERITLNSGASGVLFHGDPVTVTLDEAELESRFPLSGTVAADSRLLKALKDLRSRLAKEENVPAYVIFTNATLEDMAEKCPQTPQELLSVSGVGSAKAQRYGKPFLELLKQFQSQQ